MHPWWELLAGGAPFAPPPLAPQLPPAIGARAEAELLGGAEVWDGSPGAVTELGLGSSVQGPLGSGAWTAAWVGRAELYLDDGSIYDAHALEIGATARGRGGPGAIAGLRGSGFVASPWWEASGAARYVVAPSAALVADVHLGVARRASVDGTAVGALATMAGAAAISPRLSTSGSVEGRLWPAPDAAMLATATLDVDARLRWTPGVVVALSALAGVRVTGAGALAGLPPPGTVIGTAGLGGDWRVTRHLSVTADVEAERAFGEAEWTRVGVRAGVRAGVRRVHTPAPALLTSTVFRHVATGARHVEVLGSFSGWEALPMKAGPGGVWELAVPIGVGVWEYVYRVDGTLMVPPEAARTREDGFGGRNGVLELR